MYYLGTRERRWVAEVHVQVDDQHKDAGKHSKHLKRHFKDQRDDQDERRVFL